MNLQLASAWLDRDILGFSDIHQFAAQCRDAAGTPSRESAAMILLAQFAATFAERQEGVAVSSDVVREFVVELHRDAVQLREASAASDAQFVEALNQFAARLAKDLYM
jgi:hypothetical protein